MFKYKKYKKKYLSLKTSSPLRAENYQKGSGNKEEILSEVIDLYKKYESDIEDANEVNIEDALLPMTYLDTFYIPDTDNHLDYDFFFEYKDYVIVLYGYGEGMMIESSSKEAFNSIDYNNDIHIYSKGDTNILSKYLKEVRKLAFNIGLEGKSLLLSK